MFVGRLRAPSWAPPWLIDSAVAVAAAVAVVRISSAAATEQPGPG